MLPLLVGLVALALYVLRLVSRLNALDRRLDRMQADLGLVEAPQPRPVVPHTPPPPPVVEPAHPVVELPFESATAWEVVVGGNWLNKIGVLVFVIGLALLVGYSMAHVGPAGRVAIGFAVSGALLSAGVLMERRAEYRNYAYGLIAGGWAGIYFTSYAMRAVDAARVFDSDLIATSWLVLVATGMVLHSLRYRSPVVTTLAYIVAYATLALTPLGTFALIASVPLAISLLIVARRFHWSGVQLLAIVCTYGLYILRGRVFGFGELDLATFAPYTALAIYWLLFEAADLANLRAIGEGRHAPAPLFLVNAAGLIGAAVLQLPIDTPIPLTTFLIISGAAYLASAVVRAQLSPRPADSGDEVLAAAYGSYQGASAMAALLVTWAVEQRFSGARQTVTLLVEAEMLFLSGLILRDWLMRSLGSAVALLVSVHAVIALGTIEPASLLLSWSAQAAVGAATLTAVCWFANRELLRSRGVTVLPHEWALTPAATYLVILIARADVPDGYAAFAVFAFASLLLEAGLRRGREYRYQAYVVGASSAIVLLGWFADHRFFLELATRQDAWVILAPSVVVAYAAAWRLVPTRHFTGDDRRERIIAAGIAQTLGTAFLIELQWMVIAPAYVAVAWAGTAAFLGAAGLTQRVSGLRWQAYPVLVLALLRAMRPILSPVEATSIEIVSVLVVIGLLYAGSIAVRAAIARAAHALAEVEDAVRMGLSIVATLALGAVVYNEVRPTLITVTWGLEGVLLLAAGFPARERLMRVSGLGVLTVCILRVFMFDLPQLEALARIISFVALGAALLLVSWVYTRYRERIQRYL